MMVTALLRAFGGDKVDTIASCISISMVDAYPVSYKPFHNQLSKPAFSVSMKALVERAIALRISPLAQDVA